jgi:branched-chain amino acid transport system substrate-binding protein
MGDPIRIGAAMALTGDFSPDTELVRDGYEFAVDRINEAGGILLDGEMHEIELVIRDDGSDREVSARLLEQLIAEEEVDLLLAPWGSGNTNAVAPISERYDRVMVAPLAASDSIWEQGYEYLFGMLRSAATTSARWSSSRIARRRGSPSSRPTTCSPARGGRRLDEAETTRAEVVVNGSTRPAPSTSARSSLLDDADRSSSSRRSTSRRHRLLGR